MALAQPASLPISAPVGASRGEASNGKNVVVKVCLKSNLKNPHAFVGIHNTDNPNGSPNRVIPGNDADVNPNKKSKVQCTDAHGKELVEIREFEMRHLDTLADCGADNRICILDLRETNSCTLTIESDHFTGVNVVEWWSSQEFLLFSASKDSGILLYNIRNSGQPLYKIEDHVDPMHRKCSQIYRPAFVDNGMTVATLREGSSYISLYIMKDGKAISIGFVGYDADLVMCNVKDKADSQRVWLAGKQITQMSPIWRIDVEAPDE